MAKPDKRRIAINLKPTPAEIWANDQRVRAARQVMFDQMVREALEG